MIFNRSAPILGFFLHIKLIILTSPQMAGPDECCAELNEDINI